jgi:hypothetical protein
MGLTSTRGKSLGTRLIYDLFSVLFELFELNILYKPLRAGEKWEIDKYFCPRGRGNLHSFMAVKAKSPP